jgi:hypothetical protein
VGLRLRDRGLNPRTRQTEKALSMGDASAAPAASAASGSAPPRAATIRATVTKEKLHAMFTLMNQDEFIVNNYEKKTSNEDKTGQVWALKKLRELIAHDASQPGSVWASKVPTEQVRPFPLTYAVRASAQALILRADPEGLGPRRAEKDVRREERSTTNRHR